MSESEVNSEDIESVGECAKEGISVIRSCEEERGVRVMEANVRSRRGREMPGLKGRLKERGR